MQTYLKIGMAFFVLLASSLAQATISAKSILITDLDSGQVLLAKNDTAQRSIASITKLMTVLTVLESQQDLTEQLEIRRVRGISSYIPANINKLTREKLIDLAMVSSDNTAAYNLCYHYNGGYHNCIYAMNALARRWNLLNTYFIDPTGLFNQNVSTADDLAVILKHGLDYPFLQSNGALPSVQVDKESRNRPRSKESKTVTVNFYNTNRLLNSRSDIILTKTGWISASGGCIAMVVTKHAKNFAVVLLGSLNNKTRLVEANQLIDTYIN